MTATADTIFALASGGVPSGVAVIRISGPFAFETAVKLCGHPLPAARHASLRTIRNALGEVLDRGLVLVFPGPHSFTGEDCVEMHLHGGRAVVTAVLKSLAGFNNTRLAEPGEFSRRAFENGKMDLVEVEGLADLLAADTEMQRRLATEQASGHLSAIYDGWRDKVIFARSMLEAELDFSDEGDIPGSVSDRVWSDVRQLHDEITGVLRDIHAGEIIRDGFKVVLAGRPNAGKSSLMNALVQRDVAIVTEIAGTTRDVLHCELDLEGYKVQLFDTAGLRETDERVEQEGIRRAWATIADADLVLNLVDLSEDAAADLIEGRRRLLIGTKCDLIRSSPMSACDLLVSARTGEGLEQMRELLLAAIRDATDLGSLAIPSRLRHAQRLEAAQMHLSAALAGANRPLELRAEELRLASQELARITGRVDTEMLLGKIFSEFCVGK